MAHPGSRVFVERMAEILGVRPAAVPGMFRGARPTTVRVNPLTTVMAPEEAVLAIEAAGGPLEPVEWCANAYYLTNRHQTTPAIMLADRGIVYLQNASSLLPVIALDPQPGERILDVAAAPGGKAFHIAARTANRAELWLNDRNPQRCGKLQRLAELYGVRVHRLTIHAAEHLDKYLPEGTLFDRILLDVQCTGEGRLDLGRPGALRYWSEERLREYSFSQTKMLAVGYTLLRPGGVMVYSTCSVSPEENEIPVARILRRHADLSVEALPATVVGPSLRGGLVRWRGEKIDAGLALALRTVPSETYEGFFVARIRRSGEAWPPV